MSRAYHLNANPSLLLIAILMAMCLVLSFSQRDITEYNPHNTHSLDVIDRTGKQITIAGPDPSEQRPTYPTMCYTTPWNKDGGLLATEHSRRLHYVSPAWYTLHLNITTVGNRRQLGVHITGHQDVDKVYLKRVHEEHVYHRYQPKITPKVSLALTPESIQLLLNPQTHTAIIESLLELMQRGGLPRVGGYNGYDGLNLEMPYIWDHLPAYPNDIITYAESDIPPQNSTKHGTPSKVNLSDDELYYTTENKYSLQMRDYMHQDEWFQRRQLRMVEYHQPTFKYQPQRGTFFYDFQIEEYHDVVIRKAVAQTNTKQKQRQKKDNNDNQQFLLKNHPRHVVNQFVRKLGVAIQSFKKSFLLITTPFKATNINENVESFISKQGEIRGFNPANNEELYCTNPQHTALPKGFSHVDALYLAPYVDYFNVMTYDYSPTYNFAETAHNYAPGGRPVNQNEKVLRDIFHVTNLETQVRTVATTRLGYSPKRMWRIFTGKSSIYEGMYLEDYVTVSQEEWKEEDDDADNIVVDLDQNDAHNNDDKDDNDGGEVNRQSLFKKNNQNESTTTTTTPPSPNDTIKNRPNTKTVDSVAVQYLNRSAEMAAWVQKKAEDLQTLRDLNTNKRAHPKIDYPMCLNDSPNSRFGQAWNDWTQLCGDYQDPEMGWYQSLDWSVSRNTYLIYGDGEEEESGEGISKQFTKDTYRELLSSYELLSTQMQHDFVLKKDKPWPITSYGWSVSPTVWIRNSILFLSIPYQCISQLLSTWGLPSQERFEQKVVPINKIKELKHFLPNVGVKRDLVVPTKVDKLKYQYPAFVYGPNGEVSKKDEYNPDVDETSRQHRVVTEKIQQLCAAHLKNVRDGVSKRIEGNPVNEEMDRYCRTLKHYNQALLYKDTTTLFDENKFQRQLAYNSTRGLPFYNETTRTVHLAPPTQQQLLTQGNSTNELNKTKIFFATQKESPEIAKVSMVDPIDDDIDHDRESILFFDPLREWTFPDIHVDEVIQQQIDNNPKYNVINILAGMNWYGYLYKQPNTSPNGRYILNNTAKPIDNSQFLMREPVGMTYRQVEDFVHKWKGQIDIKHDTASGDRFMVFRTTDRGVDIVHALWYPSYQQLHRKLADIRGLADGAGIWECGQGGPKFDNLL